MAAAIDQIACRLVALAEILAAINFDLI